MITPSPSDSLITLVRRTTGFVALAVVIFGMVLNLQAGKPGSGGGDKGTTGTGPVCLLFCDELDPPQWTEIEQTLLGGLQNPLLMQSDLFLGGTVNANDYCDGREENIFAEIVVAGGTPSYLSFDSQDRDRAGLPRRSLFLDFQACDPVRTAAAGSVCTLPAWFNGATTTANLEEDGWVTTVKLKVGNQSDTETSSAFDLVGMAVGETRSDVRLTLALSAKKGDREELLWIYYHERPNTPATDLPGGITPPGDHVNVTRLSATEWLVVIPEDREASVKASDTSASLPFETPTIWHGYFRFPGAFLISKL